MVRPPPNPLLSVRLTDIFACRELHITKKEPLLSGSGSSIISLLFCKIQNGAQTQLQTGQQAVDLQPFLPGVGAGATV